MSDSAAAAAPPVDLRLLDRVYRVTFDYADAQAVSAHKLTWQRCWASEGDLAELAPTPVTLSVGSGPGSWHRAVSDLTRRMLDDVRGQLLCIHSAGLSTPEGDVIALVAPSGTGKTTASVQLGKTWGFVTDEIVALRPTGAVIPFPRPLGVSAGGAKTMHSPDELGLLAARPPLRLARIVVLRRHGSAPDPQVERLPLAAAIMALIPQISALWAFDRPLERLCRLVDAVGGVERVTYQEANTLPPIFASFRQALERPSPVSDPAAPHAEWSVADESGAAVAIGPDRIVLVGAQAAQVSGLGSVVWDELSEPRTSDDLIGAVLDAVGSPPPEVSDPREAIHRAIESLAQVGAVVREDGERWRRRPWIPTLEEPAIAGSRPEEMNHVDDRSL